MQCFEVRELLSPYLDGEIDPREGESVSGHLAVCPDCRADLLALREIVDVFKNLPEVMPPREFHTRVIDRIKASCQQQKQTGITHILRKFSYGHWSRAVAFAATLVLAVGVTLLMYGPPGKWGTKNLFPLQTAYNEISEQGSRNGGNTNYNIPGVTEPSGTQPDGGTIPRGIEPGDNAAPSAGDTLQYPGSGQDTAGSRKPSQLEQLNSLIEEEARGGTPAAPSSRVLAALQTMAVKEGAISQQTAFGYLPVSNLESSKTIRSATFSLAADSQEDVQPKLAAIAGENGGSLTANSEGVISIKVPAGRFKEVIDQIKGLGRTTLRQISGEDVTERYNNCESRLKDLAAEEQRLLALIDGAGSANSPEAQAAQSRLAQVRVNLEQQKKILRDLSERVAFAAIKIKLD